MGWRLALSIGGFLTTWFGSIPVSKTYYSDHTYVKYIPILMFVGDLDKRRQFEKSVDNVRKDRYPRELYARNYHRWFWRDPLCSVIDNEWFTNHGYYRTK